MSNTTVATFTHIGSEVPWEEAKPLIAARLAKHTKVLPNGCHEYTGYKTYLGYGDITVMGQGWRVHRLAYAVFKGPIIDGMHVCHSCDYRPCINPDHLWLGSHDDNQKDMLKKGRNAKAAKTHCIRGHDYLIFGGFKENGHRFCKECERTRPERAPAYKLSDTHCHRGHEYTPETTYINPSDGRRRCRTCQYAAQYKRIYIPEQHRPSIPAGQAE